jgi:hypothetical protein
VRLEGLGKLKKKFIQLIVSRTRDLPACSIVTQLLRYRAPHTETNTIRNRQSIVFLKTLMRNKAARFCHPEGRGEGRGGKKEKKRKGTLHGLSPQANYTDRATAACQRS